MATQKRVSVLALLEKANMALARDYFPPRGPNEVTCADHSTDAERARAYRLGVCTMIEAVLHASCNYAGFGYLDTPYQEGVTDESRRSYYYSPNMLAESRKKG